MTCAVARPCCQTADHGPDCQCWRCIAIVLDNELDAMACAASLPEVKPAPKSKPKPAREAPQATLDALMYCFRTRGMAAFNEPANKARLADLSPKQRDEFRAHISAKRPVPA